MGCIEATLVYVFDGDKCLMLHRVKKKKDLHEGKWNGLGGKMEKTESPHECALREVEEESGLHLKSIEYAGHLFFPEFDKQDNDWSVFVFTADEFTGELLDSPAEGDLAWIEKEKILELNLWDGDRHFLPLLLAGEKFMGKFTYMDGDLVDYHLHKV